MTTEYQYRVTKICPVSLYSLYQELEGAWGETRHDHKVSRSANYRDSKGNDFIVTSGVATDRLLGRANRKEVVRPKWDSEKSLIDIQTARDAANSVVIYSGSESPDLSSIFAVINIDPHEALKMFSFSKIEPEPEITRS